MVVSFLSSPLSPCDHTLDLAHLSNFFGFLFLKYFSTNALSVVLSILFVSVVSALVQMVFIKIGYANLINMEYSVYFHMIVPLYNIS